MSTQIVCDQCNQAKPCPFKVTEADGSKYDLCSGTCMQEHIKNWTVKP